MGEDELRSQIVGLQRDLAALDRLVTQKLEGHIQGHGREHDLLMQAVNEFKAYLRAKLLEMNEVREQINRERGQYPTFSVMDAKNAAIDSHVAAVDAALQSRVKALELVVSNFQGRLWMLGAGLTVIMFVLKIFWKT